ncbi:MAG: IS200/IS605 family transposase [Bacteroidota bacterium]|nr:IS200/IS605 family transposase [Bacteroidota bacterium]
MANSYTQIHLKLIFAVKYRASLINNVWKNELYKYITGIIQTQKHKMIIINGVSDHIHILIGFRPHQSLSDLMQDIKGCSSKWINEKKFTSSKFAWQEGYGAFSYSHSHLNKVINYIKNQEQHHSKVTFIEEYKSFLKAYEIEFDERYILKVPE